MRTYSQIIKEIKSGLSGNPEHDIPFLQVQKAKFVMHNLGPEVLRAVDKMILERMPQEDKQ